MKFIEAKYFNLNAIVLVTILLLLFLIYSSTVFLPYPLLDDNWIIQSYSETRWREFTHDTVAITQGRPIFAIFILLTGFVASKIGIEAMSLFRLIAIFNLAIATFFIFRWAIIWNYKPIEAFLLALIIATVPGYQIYIAGGPWLTFPLLASILATYLLFYVFYKKHKISHKLALIITAIFLLISCFSFYQPVAMTAIALMVFPIFSIQNNRQEHTINRQTLVFVLSGVITTLFSLAIYYLSWKTILQIILGDSQAGVLKRYGPNAVNFNLLERIFQFFFPERIPNILNLWFLPEVGPESPSIWTFFSQLLILVIIFSLFLKFIESLKYTIKNKNASYLRFFFFDNIQLVSICILCELPIIFSPKIINSYVTSGALSLIIIIILFELIKSIVIRIKKNNNSKFIIVFLSLVAILGIVKAQYTILTHFSVPLSLEYRLMRHEVRSYLKNNSKICGIQFMENKSPLLNSAYQEFAWSNINSSFYITRMLENILYELGHSQVRIDVVTSNGETLTDPKDKDIPIKCPPLVIDVRDFSLE